MSLTSSWMLNCLPLELKHLLEVIERTTSLAVRGEEEWFVPFQTLLN